MIEKKRWFSATRNNKTILNSERKNYYENYVQENFVTCFMCSYDRFC